MHPHKIPDSVAQRLVARRGRLRVYDKIDPAKTAFVVVDMQNAFCDPDWYLYVKDATEIVPKINQLAEALRSAGGTIVWVNTLLSGYSDWSVFFDHMVTPQVVEPILTALAPDSKGLDIWPGLKFLDTDLHLWKKRYSAFLPSSSDIAAQLRSRGIDTVLIAGTVTNICCESSARDAAMQDFKTVMLGDANAARSDEEHMASLVSFIQAFGDVMTVDEAIAAMG